MVQNPLTRLSRLQTMPRMNANTAPTKSYRLGLGMRSPWQLRKQQLLALPKCSARHRAVAVRPDRFSADLVTNRLRQHSSLIREVEWPTRSKKRAAGGKSLLRPARQPTPSAENT